MNNVMWFVLVVIVGLLVGGHMIEYVFGGCVMMLGFYALMEFIPVVKWMIFHFGRLIDLCLYIFTAYAMMSYGPTIAMSLAIFSIGYTLILVPYVKDTYNL